MKKIIKKLSKIIKIFAFICLGAYIALTIEYGIDTTLGAGIAFSVILTILTFYIERRSIEQ